MAESRSWQRGLSPRKVHPKRRPVVSEEDLQHFVLRIHKIIQLQPWTVMNMDETSWKSVDAHMRTIALRGAEEVTAFFDGDPKACVTAIATIDAAGGKLPLWVIAKGRTDRREKRFRLRYDQAIEKRKLFVTHQDSGWTSRQVAFQYLNWLREQVQGPVVLIWDLFSAHRDEEVKAAAEKLGIRLEFIPPGDDRPRPAT